MPTRVPSSEILEALEEYREAKEEGREISINALAKKHGVPTTTLYRWVKKMEGGELDLNGPAGNTMQPSPTSSSDGLPNDPQPISSDIDGLIEREIERMGSGLGEKHGESSVKVNVMPRSVYNVLDEDTMLVLSSMAFMYGFNDVNEFVKKQVLPILRSVKRIEDRFMIKVDPDKLYEGFHAIIRDAATAKALLSYIKKVIEEGGIQ